MDCFHSWFCLVFQLHIIQKNAMNLPWKRFLMIIYNVYVEICRSCALKGRFVKFLSRYFFQLKVWTESSCFVLCSKFFCSFNQCFLKAKTYTGVGTWLKNKEFLLLDECAHLKITESHFLFLIFLFGPIALYSPDPFNKNGSLPIQQNIQLKAFTKNWELFFQNGST